MQFSAYGVHHAGCLASRWIQIFLLRKRGQPTRADVCPCPQGRGGRKFWLFPQVQLARNDGFDARKLRQIVDMVTDHRERLERVWNEHFA